MQKLNFECGVKERLKAGLLLSITAPETTTQSSEVTIIARILNVQWHTGWAKKTKPANFCNNIVYCQPIFLILAHVHHRKFATPGYTVSPSNMVCVTALPCKILITTLPTCLYMFTTINNNKYKYLYFRYDSH